MNPEVYGFEYLEGLDFWFKIQDDKKYFLINYIETDEWMLSVDKLIYLRKTGNDKEMIIYLNKLFRKDRISNIL